MAFSLWLQPTAQAHTRLSAVIKQLSAQYHTPIFEPHVTLLGELTGDTESLIAGTAQLAKSIQPFIIQLTAIDYLDEYFRCLFTTVEKTHSLIDANLQARILFHRADAPEFMPHLSLMYGDFSVTIKQEIIAAISAELKISFPVARLHLWSTNGEPQAWFKVQEFLLT